MVSLGRNREFWIAAAGGVAIDRLTKLWVMQSFQLGESRVVVPGILNFTYVVNEGAAFSLFRGAAWLPWLSLVASVAIVVYVSVSGVLTRGQRLGWGLILSGAFGNGIDRFLFRHVVDFLETRFVSFPVFNIADALINLGVVCLFVEILKMPKEES